MYKGKYTLVDIKRKQFCFDPYPERKLKAEEVKNKDPFSPCRLEASQVCCSPYSICNKGIWLIASNFLGTYSYTHTLYILESFIEEIKFLTSVHTYTYI